MDNFHAQLGCFLQFGWSHIVTCQDIIGLARDRTTVLASMLLNHRLILITGMLGEGTTDHDRQPFQLIRSVGQPLLRQAHLQPLFLQPLHDRLVACIGEIGPHALGDTLSDLIHSHQRLKRSLLQRLHRMEGASQPFGHGLPYIANTQRIEHTFERHLLRDRQTLHQILRAFLRPSLQTQQIGYAQGI